MDPLFDKTIGMLSTMLDYQSRRHKIVASNIANIDTPQYTAKDLVFHMELDDALRRHDKPVVVRSNEKHFPGALGQPDNGNLEIVDSGEKVDIDGEMGKLAENHLMYNMTAELLARKFRSLNTVLKEVK
ncbi:MAG TPA: flagellar basal body rod protein FlgB [Deltaproteobacteria bacterium]|nr:flagellar basal body rod protein FlgB [Deltaproteobacteria bacterium]